MRKDGSYASLCWAGRGSCTFRFRNTSLYSAPQTVDLILFRNVAIYLTSAALQSIAGGFAAILSNKGLLLQSVTDPIPSPLLFEPHPNGTPGCYRKREEVGQRPSSSSQPVRTKPVAGRSVGRFNVRRPAPQALRAELVAPPSPQEALRAARVLADSGQIEKAIAKVDDCLRVDRTLRDAYVLRAQLHMHQQDAHAAVQDFRSALFLEPGDVLTRYWYAVALDRMGRSRYAAEQRRVIADQIANNLEEEVLTDGSTTVGELRSLLMERRSGQ